MKHIIFDFDGVIIDSFKFHIKKMNEIYNRDLTEEEYSNYLDALETEKSIWSHPTYVPEGDRITYVTLQEMEDGSVQADYYNQRRFLEELQNLL